MSQGGSKRNLVDENGDALGNATNPLRNDPTGTTAQPITDGGGSITVDATALPLPTGAATETTLAAINTKTLAAGQAVMAASSPVVIASNQTAIPITDNAGSLTVDGTVTANQGTAAALAGYWPVRVTDGTNTMPTGDVVGRAIFEKITDGTNTAAVKAASTAAVATDPALVVAISPNNSVAITAASLPLPSGAATETTLGTRLADSTFTARINTLGQKTMANSTPFVIASDQSEVASKNSASSQVDGHSVSIGATTDADTANTVIGRLKQLVTKLAGGLPAALVGGRLDSNIGAWLNSTAPTVGSKVSADSIPMVIASDQVAVASKNAVSTQVDGHSLTIGATADADTANTVIGRLKQTITKLAGGLPAALTGSGNLKVAQQEAMPSGTNRLGAVRLVDHNDVALDLARNTTVPAGSRGLLMVGEDGTGKAQAADVRVDALDGIRRLQIAGSITLSPPAAPPATTAVTITFAGTLAISTDQTDNYVITNAKRFVVQQIVCGSEGDSTEKGSCVEVSYFNGTTALLLERVYINGFTTEVYPQTDKSRNGTLCDGNGTTKTIRVVRRRLSGASQEVDFVVRGYEYTP